MGKSGSGKDTFIRNLQNSGNYHQNFNFVVKTTTRPPREGEVGGTNYFFVDEDKFTFMLLTQKNLLSATNFNNWWYGINARDLDPDKINVIELNPTEVEQLSENSEIELSLCYITASDKTRLLRCLNREKDPDVDEIVRRYQTDKKDFDDILNRIDPDIKVCILNTDALTTHECITATKFWLKENKLID